MKVMHHVSRRLPETLVWSWRWITLRHEQVRFCWTSWSRETERRTSSCICWEEENKQNTRSLEAGTRSGSGSGSRVFQDIKLSFPCKIKHPAKCSWSPGEGSQGGRGSVLLALRKFWSSFWRFQWSSGGCSVGSLHSAGSVDNAGYTRTCRKFRWSWGTLGSLSRVKF